MLLKKLASLLSLRTLTTPVMLTLWLLPGSAGDLIYDDFSKFPPGWLSSPVGPLNATIQEYHYLPHRGVLMGPWVNAICHLDAWIAGDEDGRPYLVGSHRTAVVEPRQ